MPETLGLFPGARYVGGDGPHNAEFMFVGEAPGYVEDKTGLPFQGPFGKLLNRTLEHWTSLRRGDVYVTNIVKERPPKNRTPKMSEVKKYLPSFIEELELVNPKVVVTVGGMALKAFAPKLKVTQEHGKPRQVSFGNWTGLLVPWLHLAAALRNTQYFHTLGKDAKKLIPSLSYPLGLQVGDFKLMTEEEALRKIRESGTKMLGFDTETTSPTQGKKVFMTDQADMIGWSVSWASGEAAYVDGKDFGDGMREVLEGSEYTKLCHNAKFEYKILKKLGIEMREYEDTKLVAYLIGEHPTGLKPLTSEWLGWSPPTFAETTKGRDMSELTPEEIFWYASADADNTRELWYMLSPLLEMHGLAELYENVEKPLIPILAGMEKCGVLVDELETLKVKEELVRFAALAGEEVRKYLTDDDGGMNINSGVQMEEKLLEMGAPLKKRTKSDEHYSVDADALQGVRGWYPELIDAILIYRKYGTMINFANGFLVLRGPDGRLHTSLNQAGHYEELGGGKEAPATGRFSLSGPNLSNIPHHRAMIHGVDWGKRLRRCLIAKEGFTLMSADLGQEEPRIIAVHANDQTLIDGFNNGKDVYRLATEALYPNTVNGDTDADWKREFDHYERFVGKQTVLAKFYGAGDGRIQQLDPLLSPQAVKRASEALDEAHPAIRTYIEYISNKLREVGYTESLFGRKRWYPEAYSGKVKVFAEAVRMGANQEIQSTAADVLKMAMITIDKGFRDLGLESQMLFPVHDELVIEVKDEEFDTVVGVLSKAFDVLDGVRMVLDVFKGVNWGDKEFVCATE